jgi:hypothetical protein
MKGTRQMKNTTNDKNMTIDGIMVTTTRSCRTSNGSSHSFTFTLDYTGVTVADLIKWGTSNRVIAGQRVWEKMTKAELDSSLEGKTVKVASIGKSVKTREQRINDVMAAIPGMSLEMAAHLVDHGTGESDEVEESTDGVEESTEESTEE